MNPYHSIPTNFSHNKKQNTQNSYPNNQNMPQNNQTRYSNPYPNNQMNYNNPYPNNQMNYSNPYNQYPQQGYQQQGYPNQGYGNNNYNPYQNAQMSGGFQQNQMMNNQMNFAMKLIDNYADNIFLKHDDNRSGFLDVNEIYPAVCEVFQVSGKAPPNYQQVLQIMRNFDSDGNGLIDKEEFRQILKKALYL